MSPSEFFFLLSLAIIIHSAHYLFSDWSEAYSEFSKSAPGTSSSCRLYNNHVKDTQGHGLSCHAWPWCMICKGNHVKFACFVLLAVSEEAKTWLPGLLRWPSKTSKKYLNTRTHKRKKIDEGGKGAVRWLHEREKRREPKEKKELAQTLKTFYVKVRKKGFVQCIIKQLLDSVFAISRIIKVSIKVISRSR